MPIYLGDTLISNGYSSKYTLVQDISGLTVSPDVVMYPMETAFLEYTTFTSPCGDLSDLPPTIKYVYSSLGMTGDLEDLPSSVIGLLIESSDITGDLSDIPSGVTYIKLYNDQFITGDLADLGNNLTYLNVSSSPLISGIYTAGVNIHLISLGGTAMSADDTDATLIALDASGAENGSGIFCGNRTAASDDAVASLGLKGWELMVE